MRDRFNGFLDVLNQIANHGGMLAAESAIKSSTA